MKRIKIPGNNEFTQSTFHNPGLKTTGFNFCCYHFTKGKSKKRAIKPIYCDHWHTHFQYILSSCKKKKKEALFMALENKVLSQDITLNLIGSTGKL